MSKLNALRSALLQIPLHGSLGITFSYHQALLKVPRWNIFQVTCDIHLNSVAHVVPSFVSWEENYFPELAIRESEMLDLSLS